MEHSIRAPCCPDDIDDVIDVAYPQWCTIDMARTYFSMSSGLKLGEARPCVINVMCPRFETGVDLDCPIASPLGCKLEGSLARPEAGVQPVFIYKERR